MQSHRIFKDQMGQSLRFDHPPNRIVSLVPSQTELLSEFGLDEVVKGITSFCVHPAHWRVAKTIVGGTKKFDFEIIERLQPDLIIGNKEENYREGIERLQEKYPVWMSDITTLEDAFEMIKTLGDITDCETQASQIVRSIRHSFKNVKKVKEASVLYVIWRKPWMAAGKNTFIDTLLGAFGLRNVIQRSRYPELTSEMINELNPQYVFLSSEPYPFKEKNINELKRIAPQSKIVLVDGEMFSWYGSRLMKVPEYFNSLNL